MKRMRMRGRRRCPKIHHIARLWEVYVCKTILGVMENLCGATKTTGKRCMNLIQKHSKPTNNEGKRV